MVADSVQPAGDISPYPCNPPFGCLDCLSASELSRELTPEQIKALFEVMSVHRLAAGEVLIAEGEYDDHLYAVAGGEFEVTRKDGDHEVPLARLSHRAITGELAFLDGLKRTATVRATTDNACAIAIKRNDLEWLLRRDPQLVYRFMRAVLRNAHKTVSSMDKSYVDFLNYVRN